MLKKYTPLFSTGRMVIGHPRIPACIDYNNYNYNNHNYYGSIFIVLTYGTLQ